MKGEPTQSDKSARLRIRELEAEVAHLKSRLGLSDGAGRLSVFTPVDNDRQPPRSIAGLDEMYLQVDEHDTVTNLNQKMADLIGLPKEDLLSKPIAHCDRISWAPGVFAALVGESRANSGSIQWETEYGDPQSNLDRSVVFRASFDSTYVSITAQDVTDFKRIMTTFARYVSPAVIEKMHANDRDYFRIDRMRVSVLFADLRGFTAMSSTMDPAEVKYLLDEFLESAIAAADSLEGTVDKIIGDEIMVLFGAPVPSVDHAYRAVRAAITMQLQHQRVLEKWASEGRPTPPLGVGLNSGDVVVGNVGSSRRMDYTAIGHAVNVASRLCSVANGGEILVSEGLVQSLTDYTRLASASNVERIQLQKAGTMLLKGLQREVEVAKVLF